MDMDDDRPPYTPRRARREAPATVEQLRAQLERTERRLWIERQRVTLLEQRIKQVYSTALGTWGTRRQP